MNITFENLPKQIFNESFHSDKLLELYSNTIAFVNNRVTEKDYSDFIYKLLTVDHYWEQYSAKNNLKNTEIYKTNTELYNEFIKQLSRNAQNMKDKNDESMWEQAYNFKSWFYLIKKERKARAKVQKKIYLTLNKNGDKLKHNLEAILRFFSSLNSAQMQGQKHFKLPSLYSNYLKLLDNFIIYYETDFDLSVIENLVKSSGLLFIDRDLYSRTKYGTDGTAQGKSDTQLIADAFTNYILSNSLKIKNTNKTREETITILGQLLRHFSLNATHR